MSNVHTTFLAVLSLASIGCTSPTEPVEKFGTIALRVGEQWWVTSAPADSVVALYDPQMGLLTITGQVVGGAGAGALISIALCGQPSVRTHPMRRQPDGAVGVWFEPARGTAFGRPGSQPRAYTSTGAVPDSLTLGEFDWSSGRIRGSFRFGAVEQPGGRQVQIVGRFDGRWQLGGLGVCSR